jgi:choline dehydrogenase-like flavoprotein
LNLYAIDFGKTKYRAEIGISEEKQRELKILNGTASLTPLEIARQQRAFIDVWTSNKDSNDKAMSGFDDIDKSKLTKKIYASYQLFTRVEQAPNPNSRITLDIEKDALGMRRAMLHWELTPLEKHSLREIYKLIGQQLGIAGVGRVRLMDFLQNENDNSWPEFAGAGWHHMGTTRMSDDAKQGVVDANCKVHGIINLHIAGASCYPTAGAPNPTLTVVALTIRLADRLKKIMQSV